MPDGALEVLELDAAVGTVHDQREPVAHAELLGDSRSFTTARMAGRSGVTGTRIRSARSKIARLSGL